MPAKSCGRGAGAVNSRRIDAEPIEAAGARSALPKRSRPFITSAVGKRLPGRLPTALVPAPGHRVSSSQILVICSACANCRDPRRPVSAGCRDPCRPAFVGRRATCPRSSAGCLCSDLPPCGCRIPDLGRRAWFLSWCLPCSTSTILEHVVPARDACTARGRRRSGGRYGMKYGPAPIHGRFKVNIPGGRKPGPIFVFPELYTLTLPAPHGARADARQEDFFFL